MVLVTIFKVVVSHDVPFKIVLWFWSWCVGSERCSCRILADLVQSISTVADVLDILPQGSLVFFLLSERRMARAYRGQNQYFMVLFFSFWLCCTQNQTLLGVHDPHIFELDHEDFDWLDFSLLNRRATQLIAGFVQDFDKYPFQAQNYVVTSQIFRAEVWGGERGKFPSKCSTLNRHIVCLMHASWPSSFKFGLNVTCRVTRID